MIAQPVFSDARMWLPQPQHAHYATAAPLYDTGRWLGPALRKVAELRELPSDWDSYGSSPISATALDSARHFLNSVRRFAVTDLDVVPVAGGGIGLVFQNGDKELEIEILPEGGITFLQQGAGVVEGEGDEGSFSPFAYHVSARLMEWLLSD